MFYTVEEIQGRSYFSGYSAPRDAWTWTVDPDRSRTYGKFSSAALDAEVLSYIVGKPVSVVRYDGAWIKNATRTVIETFGGSASD